MKRQVAVLLLLLQVLAICFADEGKPEQVHIAFGNTVDTIVVTWSTIGVGTNGCDLEPSTVQYGIKTLDKTATGSKVPLGNGPIIQIIHNVTLPNLERSTEYMYKCGNEKTGWSEVFHFRIPPPDDVWKPTLSIYGDMGLTHNHALPRLINETNAKKYDAIFHLGGFAYYMDEREGRQGDDFMNMIEPVAAKTPYMTCVGTPESGRSRGYDQYYYRFNMPGKTEDSGIYSINMGPAHFIFLATDTFSDYQKTINKLLKFTKKDLIKANLPENRAKQPWIIVMGHRPLYCSNKGKDCNNPNCPYRKYLEKMFYTYGVDMVIGAHEHSYERMWPVYDYKVYNGTESPYQDPDAPIILVSGNAGCREYTDHFVKPSPYYSAFRSRDYGTTTMYVHNQTHIHFERISDNKNGMVIDDFWVIKHSHKFYPGSNMTLTKLREHCNEEFDYFERKQLCNNMFMNVEQA